MGLADNGAYPVQPAECHIRCPDHQRDEEVAEGPHQDRHRHEKDHDRAVHGDQIDRHMQLVLEQEVICRAEFPIRPRIQDLPIELLACYPDRDIAGRHAPFHFFPDLRARKIDAQVEQGDDKRWHEDPGSLPKPCSRDIGRSVPRSAPIADDEEE